MKKQKATKQKRIDQANIIKKNLKSQDSLLYDTEVSKMIVERTNEGFTFFDTELNFVKANQAACNIFDVILEKLIGQNLHHFASKREISKLLNHKKDLIHTPIIDQEIEISRSDNQKRILLMTTTPIKHHAHFKGFGCHFRDITERKKIESELNYRLEFEKLIAGLSTDFVRLRSEEVDKGINHALRSIGLFVNADRSYAFQLFNDNTIMKKTHDWIANDINSTMARNESQLVDSFPWIFERLNQFKIIHIPRVSELPKQASAEKIEFEKRSIKSLIIVPMVCADTLMGFVGFDAVKAEKDWSGEVIALLRIVGELCANFIVRRQTEYALRESEDRYRDLVEHSQDLICTHTLDGTILSVNEGSARSLEYFPDVLIGMNIRDIIVPENRKEFNKYLQQIKKNGRAYGYMQVLTFTGKRKVWQYDNTLRTEGIKTPIVRGMAHDVTHRIQTEKALQASEEMYRTLAEASQQGIAIYQNRKIVFANEALASSLGYTIKELLSLSPKKIIGFVLPEDRHVLENRSQDRLSGMKITTWIEFRIIRRDKSIRWFQIFVTSITYNRKAAFLATTLDITKRKQAEEKVNASLAEKEALLKEIHHRVKNNMQVISSLLSLQSKSISDKKVRELFKESQNRIRTMSLVHETLYRTQNFAQINLSIYIKEIAGRVFRAYSKDTTRIGLGIDTEEVSLSVDRALPIGLVINELVSNSLKHAFPDKDQKKCEIKIALRPSAKGEIELKVFDNGVGLPGEIDFQTTKSMGLSLVNILTKEQLHGDILLDRSQGTQFTITLPN